MLPAKRTSVSDDPSSVTVDESGQGATKRVKTEHNTPNNEETTSTAAPVPAAVTSGVAVPPTAIVTTSSNQTANNTSISVKMEATPDAIVSSSTNIKTDPDGGSSDHVTPPSSSSSATTTTSSKADKETKDRKITNKAPIAMGIVDPHSGLTNGTIVVDVDDNGVNAPLDVMLVRVDRINRIDQFFLMQLIERTSNSAQGVVAAAAAAASSYVMYSRNGNTGSTGNIMAVDFDNIHDACLCFKETFEEKTGLTWEQRQEPAKPGKYRCLNQDFAQTHAGDQNNNVKWQYEVNGDADGKASGWHDYTDEGNVQTERLYQEFVLNPALTNRITTSGDWTYDIDFVNMTQTNMTHPDRKSRRIRRATDDDNDDDEEDGNEDEVVIPNNNAKWQYWVDDGVDGKAPGWYDYTQQGNEDTERFYQEYVQNPRLSSRITTVGMFTYNINFLNMTQINQTTGGKSRRIRRAAADDNEEEEEHNEEEEEYEESEDEEASDEENDEDVGHNVTSDILVVDGTPCDAMLGLVNPFSNTDQFHILQVQEKSDGSYAVYQRSGTTGTHGKEMTQQFNDMNYALMCFVQAFEAKTGLSWDEKDDPPKAGKYRFIQQNYTEKKNGYSSGKWQYYLNQPSHDGKGVGWHNYPADSNKQTERLFQEFKMNEGLMNRLVRSGNWTYAIDFKKMTQTNATHPARTSRPIRRI